MYLTVRTQNPRSPGPAPNAPSAPRVVPERSALLNRCVGFTASLREAGLRADPASTVDFLRALQLIDLARSDDFRAAAETTLVRRREDLEPFRECFNAFWFGHRGLTAEVEQGDSDITGNWPKKPTPVLQADGEEDGDEHAAWSAAERLGERDLASLSGAQIERARRLIREFARLLPSRPARRLRVSHHGRRPDFRRLLGGQVLRGVDDTRQYWRHRPPRKARLVLICDVSGSMRGYSEFLLELIYGMLRELPTTDIAVFSTRLTVVSQLIDARDPVVSLREVLQRATDWGGGTDIGHCLAEFNRLFEHRLSGARPVVVFLSDGWDRGDADIMKQQMARLARYAQRILWLTPLLRYAGYEPLTRGMQTALPHIDQLIPCHSLDTLARFAQLLRRQWD